MGISVVRKGINLIRDFLLYFCRGWQAKQALPYAKAFFKKYIVHLNEFRQQLYADGLEIHSIRDKKICKLKMTSQGLHSLLPNDPTYSYSILIVVSSPKGAFFRRCLESVFSQSAPSFEVLVGCTQEPSHEVEQALKDYKKLHRHIQVFDFLKDAEPHRIVLQLAEKAKGHFLFLMGEEDWIRPDLLLRYEQILRIHSNPENYVLYCDIQSINRHGAVMAGGACRQPELHFPYFFQQMTAKGLLIPSRLWKKMGSAPLCTGAEGEDLLLRLDLAGAHFQHVPFSLYYIAGQPSDQTTKMCSSFLKVLEKYAVAKKLDWRWEPGLQEKSVRAIPQLGVNHVIQVVIPFKDQKELTLRCIRTLIAQRGVQIKITAVDNRSQDKTIGEEIVKMGGEVLFCDEPFNYSRLNNRGVKNTCAAAECDVLLFLNNDVELDPNALKEMLGWLGQPDIGMVGCRLLYPDGRLQHGGVVLNESQRKEMRWEHVEKLRSFDELDLAKNLGVVDAVTAACAMIKKETFLAIGGFDEIWYPIGYSDTNLAVKLADIGLKCFYTPYAVGIHHESVSRQSSIEDFENSKWLHTLWLKRHRADKHAGLE